MHLVLFLLKEVRIIKIRVIMDGGVKAGGESMAKKRKLAGGGVCGWEKACHKGPNKSGMGGMLPQTWSTFFFPE